MHRAYAEPSDIQGGQAVIRGDEAKHIRSVLRMQPGETFIAFDGTGMDYVCSIVSVGAEIEAQVVSSERNRTEPGIRVTLYQAYPKSAKMEDIVQKAVELGAAGIIPFISQRCVKRPEDGARLRRVALAAVKQCGRSVLPEVTDVLSFDKALARMKAHDRLIACWEEEKKTSLREALQGDDSDIGVVIGPEGGFEAAEVMRMRGIGGISATLGPRILRTETAGIAVLSAVFFEKGQMQY
jgi:RNA methyltransferase, RsmE family